MIAHLSSEQLSECMLGQASPMVARHVEDCPACRAELGAFRAALGEFRGAVHAWSQDQASAALAIPAAVPQRVSGMFSHQLAWALLIAGLCVIASFILPRHRADGAGSTDAVLLNQVDTEISRSVPSSMEPLMKLVVEK